jgi:hypothetical protein
VDVLTGLIFVGVLATDVSGVNPRRSYPVPVQPHAHLAPFSSSTSSGEYLKRENTGTMEEEPLDPVSALLRAGEIVNRGNRGD